MYAYRCMSPFCLYPDARTGAWGGAIVAGLLKTQWNSVSSVVNYHSAKIQHLYSGCQVFGQLFLSAKAIFSTVKAIGIFAFTMRGAGQDKQPKQ